MATIRLVLNSSQGGLRVWPCMYMVARMYATMKMKKAMPRTDSASGRDVKQHLEVVDQSGLNRLAGNAAVGIGRRAARRS